MTVYENILELAKRRGFFWYSSEIYGGISGFIDLGPLGTSVKLKIESLWRDYFIQRHQDFIVEIDTPVVMPAKTFEASGHLNHFTDYVVECVGCRRKFRADMLLEEALSARGSAVEGLERLGPEELQAFMQEHGVKCPECGGEVKDVKKFNLLFRTTIGPYSDSVGYMRPEAAQGMFTSFQRVYTCSRERLPLGIAQIGKVLRNEISPRQGPIRLREFTIMEVELFFDPQESGCGYFDRVRDTQLSLILEEDVRAGKKEPRVTTAGEAVAKRWIINEWNAYFMALASDFASELGIPAGKQRFVEMLPEERAHYSRQTFDQKVLLEKWGWVEISGHAYRGDYDLDSHWKYSGADLRVSRQLATPKEVEITHVRPQLAAIRRDFKDRSASVLEAIAKLDPAEVRQRMDKANSITVAGFTLTPQHLRIEKTKSAETTEKFLPHVCEPSFGAERLLYAALENAYSEKDDRVVLRLPRRIAPASVAVLPLVRRPPITQLAQEVRDRLTASKLEVTYDEAGSIGRRYARLDEIGVPLAITVDYQSAEDNTVTVRDRDSWRQVRLPVTGLAEKLNSYLSGHIDFSEVGTPHTRAAAGEE